jgi:hypothetical protein
MRSPLDAALRYAQRGWAVFPCHEPAMGGCSCHREDCPSPAKHPRTPHGLRDASTDPEVVSRWWRRWPDANIGVRTGGESGLIVLDVDPDHGGLRSLVELERRHGRLPPSLTVRTGTGRHYWFRHPGWPLRNSAGRLGPGIDLRGDGGYIIAPPSRHASGRRYQWTCGQPLAPAPHWLLALAREPTRLDPPISLRQHPAPNDTRPWARAALDGELARIRTATHGSRNHTLNRSSFALGQLVAAGHLHEEPVRSALLRAGLDVGLTPREVQATVASGLRAGSRSPRSPSTSRGGASLAPPG